MGEDSRTPPIPPAPEPSSESRGPHGALSPGTTVGRRYTIVELLGRGVAGAVYKARDEDLGQQVAIRTITFDDGTDAAARSDMERRFRREAQLAREITHPHVARILDISEAEGMLFVAMPLIEGEPLSALMQRRGPLPVRDAVNIARQIVDGLTAAHDRGVVHRDLKPENVMVADGTAVILDLGMARSNATQSGFGGISGTVEYMAPEQSRGAGVDARADIYAVGLIIYDMLTGRKRLQGHDSAMAELLFRMRSTPAPIGKLVPGVPPAVDAIISRATHPNPDRRFASAAQMLSALSAVGGGDGPSGDSAHRSWWPQWR